MNDFSRLGLRPELIDSATAQGFAQMTPVQAQTLPAILAGTDVLAQAETGSGKTAAFGFGLLNRLIATDNTPQALILCPTRELADQVSQALRQFAAPIGNVKLMTLCGGSPMRAQINSLARPPHIVVGTPGRVLAHLRRASLSAPALQTLVLDEADRMLDMGFIADIQAIVDHLPADRQTLLFSATWPDAVREISPRLQRDPAHITATTDDTPTRRISEIFHRVDDRDKLAVLERVLADARRRQTGFMQALVFCNRRETVDRVAEHLTRRGVAALALHGDRDQRERDEVLLRFANQSCAVLVATDVAARGLDIPALPLVVSVDLAGDVATHTHRIGRTGRAGESGRAVSLATPGEGDRAERIAAEGGFRLNWSRWPESGGQAGAKPPMATLVIQGGRRDKLRPGDILGALTGDGGLSGADVGKIDIADTRSYVAIARAEARPARDRLRKAGIKKKRFRVAILAD
ncbi:ATP-dependent RNA helicase DbpA [Salinisphaera sp. Q1T1-3]|uniref:ATP-dependent RNA helicase DbpA n=1 Tax=Salinisphaera sp. Q1T1-3 TaxID=2321229 RepID=UPI000E71883A|nr:ATP-dependent RNA helicase DbpA [Salinisphaera sp. Q1T1-3]RJS93603.1 ATP-dependent RNA helicase DbpA [Salinisphaera sp. Q1T1-3]